MESKRTLEKKKGAKKKRPSSPRSVKKSIEDEPPVEDFKKVQLRTSTAPPLEVAASSVNAGGPALQSAVGYTKMVEREEKLTRQLDALPLQQIFEELASDGFLGFDKFLNAGT